MVQVLRTAAETLVTWSIMSGLVLATAGALKNMGAF